LVVPWSSTTTVLGINRWVDEDTNFLYLLLLITRSALLVSPLKDSRWRRALAPPFSIIRHYARGVRLGMAIRFTPPITDGHQNLKHLTALALVFAGDDVITVVTTNLYNPFSPAHFWGDGNGRFGTSQYSSRSPA
jgi:hypothetical protein